mgnify:CR=1 FL=1
MFRNALFQLQDALIQDKSSIAMSILQDPTFDVTFHGNPTHNLLSLAAANDSQVTLRLLAARCKELDLVRRLNDQTHPIHFEAAAGNIATTLSLLNQSPALLQMTCKGRYTPLALAAMANQYELLDAVFKSSYFEQCDGEFKLTLINHLIAILSNPLNSKDQLPKLKSLNCVQSCLLNMADKNPGVWRFIQRINKGFEKAIDTYAPPAGSVSERIEESTLGVDLLETLRLHERASTFGFVVTDIPRDGNCLFAAIADQLNHQNINDQKHDAKSLRKLAITHLQRYQKAYENHIPGDFDSAMQKAARPGTFGDHPHLLAIARELNLQVVVLNSDEDMPQAHLNVRKPRGTLCLGFEAGLNSHYQSLRFSSLHDIVKDLVSNETIDPFLMADSYEYDSAQEPGSPPFLAKP